MNPGVFDLDVFAPDVFPFSTFGSSESAQGGAAGSPKTGVEGEIVLLDVSHTGDRIVQNLSTTSGVWVGGGGVGIGAGIYLAPRSSATDQPNTVVFRRRSYGGPVYAVAEGGSLSVGITRT